MSCVNNTANINETFVIEPMFMTGESATWTACTGVYTNLLASCDGNAEIILSTGQTIFNTSIVPLSNGVINLGSNSYNFATLYALSGLTSYWSATTSVTTPTLNLGLDSLSNSRILTADNSILQGDILDGGSY